MKKMLFLSVLIGLNTSLAGRENDSKPVTPHKHNEETNRTPQEAFECTAQIPHSSAQLASHLPSLTPSFLKSLLPPEIIEFMHDKSGLEEDKKVHKYSTKLLERYKILCSNEIQLDKFIEKTAENTKKPLTIKEVKLIEDLFSIKRDICSEKSEVEFKLKCAKYYECALKEFTDLLNNYNCKEIDRYEDVIILKDSFYKLELSQAKNSDIHTVSRKEISREKTPAEIFLMHQLRDYFHRESEQLFAQELAQHQQEQ